MYLENLNRDRVCFTVQFSGNGNEMKTAQWETGCFLFLRVESKSANTTAPTCHLTLQKSKIESTIRNSARVVSLKLENLFWITHEALLRVVPRLKSLVPTPWSRHYIFVFLA